MRSWGVENRCSSQMLGAFHIRKDLWVSATATLKLRNIKSLPEVCRRECEAAELRLSNGRFKVGDVDDYQDSGRGTR